MSEILINFRTTTQGVDTSASYNTVRDILNTQVLFDSSEVATSVRLELIAGSVVNFFANTETIPNAVFEDAASTSYRVFPNGTNTIKVSGLPVNQPLDITLLAQLTERDLLTDITVGGVTKRTLTGVGATELNTYWNSNEISSDANGEILITGVPVAPQGAFFGAMRIFWQNIELTADPSASVNSTLNYTPSGLGTITSAILTDSANNVLPLTTVTDTSAFIPDYANGQFCLSGPVTLTVSDGTSSATTDLILEAKTGFEYTSLTLGFTQTADDWTFGFTPAPVVGTQVHWSDPNIVLLGDGSITGVSSSGTLTAFVIDPSDGVMSSFTLTFESAGGSSTYTKSIIRPIVKPIVKSILNN